MPHLKKSILEFFTGDRHRYPGGLEGLVPVSADFQVCIFRTRVGACSSFPFKFHVESVVKP